LLPNPSRLIIDVHGNDVRRAAAEIKTKAGGNSAVKTPLLNKTQTAALSRCDPEDPSPSCASDAGGNVPKQEAANKNSSRSGEEQGEKTVQPIIVSGSTSPKKKIVEADDDDDSAASLDHPEVKPAIKAKGKTQTSSQSKNNRRASASAVDVHEAQPNAAGDRSLIRALGLKIGKIVIDPGHGGHDTGTIGPHRLLEKELVLEVSRRLGKLLETRLGADVVYTRKDDTFVPLETRTAIANQEQADLFVSIHANASDDPDARGVETYYLNFTSSKDALEVAARENAVSENSIHELQDLVKKIALKEKIEESREFAANVESSLHSGLAARNPGLRDRGVKKAPFIVLIGANMPSILAEISFVSNPADERRLQTSDYRQRIAESLYRGIAKYVGGLSGVKVASKMDKGAGQ
jgi:N-acetylmuramoyl-L-alanine amidase